MMIEFDEYKVKLNGLKPKLDELAASLGIGTLFLPLMLMPRSRAICRFIQFTSRHIFCSPARSSRSVGLCVL